VARRLTVLAPTRVTPKPLARVSPSLGERLLLCELSVAFRLDDRYNSLRRQAPAAALGNVAHELAEGVAAGTYDDVSDGELQVALASAWADGVAREERRLAETYDAAPLPPPTRWPGYAQTEVRTLDLLFQEARARRHANAPVAGPHLEEELRPDAVPLYGRADRVESRNGAIEIIDLKTGWTLPDEIKPSHRRQLLAYAFLWHAIHGEWPTTASIQRLDGARMTFAVTPAEAEEVATELIVALNRYNDQVAERESLLKLARPSPEACRYCSYRPACEPFFAAASPDWGWYRRSIIGDVTTVAVGRAHTRVEIAVRGGTIETPQVNIINWPTDLAPSLSDRVAIIDATPTAIATDLRLAWDSAICRWEPEAATSSAGV
jgi:RecB family exonuclease